MAGRWESKEFSMKATIAGLEAEKMGRDIADFLNVKGILPGSAIVAFAPRVDYVDSSNIRAVVWYHRK